MRSMFRKGARPCGLHKEPPLLNMKSFESKEKFDLWYEEGKQNVNYALKKGVSTQCGMRIYYNCNRSESKGFKSQGMKNMLTTGGSIKLQGTCPSRIIANLIENEKVRAQRLTKKEQIYIADQMKQPFFKEAIQSIGTPDEEGTKSNNEQEERRPTTLFPRKEKAPLNFILIRIVLYLLLKI